MKHEIPSQLKEVQLNHHLRHYIRHHLVFSSHRPHKKLNIFWELGSPCRTVRHIYTVSDLHSKGNI